MNGNNQIFSPAQRSLLTDVINQIVPAKDKLPGAGNLGIAAYIEEAAARTPGLTRLFNDGLAQIAVAAGRALQEAGREVIRFHFRGDVVQGLNRLREALT